MSIKIEVLMKLPISSKARPSYPRWIKKVLRFGKARSEQPIPQTTLKDFCKRLIEKVTSLVKSNKPKRQSSFTTTFFLKKENKPLILMARLEL